MGLFLTSNSIPLIYRLVVPYFLYSYKCNILNTNKANDIKLVPLILFACQYFKNLPMYQLRLLHTYVSATESLVTSYVLKVKVYFKIKIKFFITQNKNLKYRNSNTMATEVSISILNLLNNTLRIKKIFISQHDISTYLHTRGCLLTSFLCFSPDPTTRWGCGGTQGWDQGRNTKCTK